VDIAGEIAKQHHVVTGGFAVADNAAGVARFALIWHALARVLADTVEGAGRSGVIA